MHGTARTRAIRAAIQQLKGPQRFAFPAATRPTLSRGLAKVRDLDGTYSGPWFNSTPPGSAPDEPAKDHQPPDERTLKLGQTIRILHERLPTLLASPLPQELLSPQISLHLFPSTHPHLPVVSGKIPYTAALWTAPVAWGRLPVVGNVKLIILSERLVKNGVASTPTTTFSADGYRNERLIVRWKTCGKTKGHGVGAFYRGVSASESKAGSVDKITQFLGGDEESDDKEFCGLFMFEFDEEGRIIKHVIEHVEEGSNWEKMPNFVNVTDWLLGKAWGRKEEHLPPGIALGCVDTWEGWTHKRQGTEDER